MCTVTRITCIYETSSFTVSILRNEAFDKIMQINKEFTNGHMGENIFRDAN